MAGLLYKESNGFTDFDQVQNNINNEEYIDFNELLPEQEKVFQMIRSCLWEGDAQPELLKLVGLNQLLATEQDDSRRLVVSINQIRQFAPSLPESVTPEAITALSWGPSVTNDASMEKIEKMLNDLSSIRTMRGISELRSLVHHLSAFRSLLDLSKCTRMQSLYQNDIRERLCHNFVPSLHALSCCFGLLTLGTMMLFLLSFCTGHRVLARLERLEYSDYLNRRQQEEEEEAKEQLEEDSYSKSSPSSVEDPHQSLILVEEKMMPVYDQSSASPVGVVVASAVQEHDQVLDLVYIPPPMYIYGSPSEPQEQQQ